tara:strand:- start:341 stop:673 length:333 start_codon:yes stop_codon:yes gene_type:complete
MNWNEESDFVVATRNNKLYVTLTVNHVHGKRNFQEKFYDTDFVITYLKENNISFEKTLEHAMVYNYQSQSRCQGTWVFSLPSKPKPKKTSKPLEKKENVPKMTNKKTIKK